MLRKENQNKRHNFQEYQVPQEYWSTHEGKFKLPAKLPPTGKHRNNMRPSVLAVHHPTYETLKIYATGGVPFKDWPKFDQRRNPYVSDKGSPRVSFGRRSNCSFSAEAKEEVALNQTRLVCYKKFKVKFPTKMKVSPIAEISHKSKELRSILDLSFSLKLNLHGNVPFSK